MIVDSGSCCSSRLVDKLALTIVPHPKPYKLQWIKDDEGIVVKNQVSIQFIMKMFYVIWYPWKLDIFYSKGHGNLISMLFMMVLPIKLSSIVRERK